MNETSKVLWFDYGKQLLSFVVGVVVASFVVGGARQKIVDIAEWKDEVSPKIERMDNKGTLSFELFHEEYLRELKRTDERLKEVERDIKELGKNK